MLSIALQQAVAVTFGSLTHVPIAKSPVPIDGIFPVKDTVSVLSKLKLPLLPPLKVAPFIVQLLPFPLRSYHVLPDPE